MTLMESINWFNATHKTRDILNWNIALSVVFSLGTVGIALKFLWIFYQSGVLGYSINFPWFPNYLDSTFLSIGSIYFLWGKLKEIRRSNEPE